MQTKLKEFRKFVKSLSPVFGDDRYIQLNNAVKNINALEDTLSTTPKNNLKKQREIENDILRKINFIYDLFK